ncbi:MAG: Coenzyme F420 hydrogenase/dehydrogenase, beta subunit C-terminal domain [Deltaproteobacteria bacterium]|nr:MAG: Coenzyme F420 hydrogenase/dehydrogenase, beta subunit C-terminal domain [Deltaproteobacteria bacterium]
MPVFGPNELLEDVIYNDLCIGCGACVDLCPYFKSHKGKTAMLFPCTLSQGRCYAHCPKAEVDLGELASKFWGEPYEGAALGKYRQVVVSRAGEKMEQGTFQSGGTVSALMTLALQSGMIDAAVLTEREGLVPVPRLVTSPEDVALCATSKYTAAPTLAAFNQAVEEGYSRIGVVGTPCQLMAVGQMRSNPLKKEDFKDPVALVVGLFCTWALDTRKLITFLSEKMDISKIQGMDIPPPPAEILVVQSGDGKVEFPLSEIRPMIVNSCHICPDMTSEWSDVSVGVLEGQPEWNTLIIRTEKGGALVEKACQEGYLQVKEIPEENLDHLRFAAGNKKKRALTTAGKQGLLNNNEERKRSALRINEEVVKRITEED